MKNLDKNNWIEEELTIAEFCEKILGLNNFDNPSVYDISDRDIFILGKDLKTKEDVYKKLNNFIVKENSDEHYTDGHLKATAKHTIIEPDGQEIYVENHPDFKKINEPIKVVDFEVDEIKNYYANGRLNHNTTPGGKAMPYSCSVRIRTASLGKLKKGDEVIGMKCQSQVIKNRCGPNYRFAEFEIHYDSGIQNLASWLKFAKEREIISGTAAKYTWNRENGEKLEFNTTKFVELMNSDSKLKEEFYQAICKVYIMEYRDPNSKIVEDIEEQNTENDDLPKSVDE